MATLIDGRALAKEVNVHTKQRIEKLKEKGVTPGIATILVGDDPASHIYTRSKEKKAHSLGMKSVREQLPASTTQAELVQAVEHLNSDPSIHAILVQEPLPNHLDDTAIVNLIDPLKDVDGFHPINVGKLYNNVQGNYPVACTPRGIMTMLRHYHVPLASQDVVIVGRSTLVSRPLQALLINEDATVTITGRRTKDLAKRTREADILVVAAGVPNLIKADAVKPGATVIDVGINRLDDGTIVGDVDFESVKEVAGMITPVPGGVGPMTIASLMEQTVDLAEWSAEING
ncbi:bifunctional 5,10-methylenetetrahydrofolate dehydrogenase/5,10-methenyltetrahydrofolate cyclohydrolase [Limosilactobacillus mucosae]|nr:bifunctional methylenetetrahydrofolate dehydrogenase/methenyltetrahydrofolate cyclohydrolase [Limosilactobacillus mucosae]